jgi:hypothetical protein
MNLPVETANEVSDVIITAAMNLCQGAEESSSY